MDSIGSPLLWGLTIGVVVALVALDFVLTRRPHEVSMREAIGWSAFYIALPLAFGVWVWQTHGSGRGVSALDTAGGAFFDPAADTALFDAIRSGCDWSGQRRLVELDCHINDPAFAAAAVEAFHAIAF